MWWILWNLLNFRYFHRILRFLRFLVISLDFGICCYFLNFGFCWGFTDLCLWFGNLWFWLCLKLRFWGWYKMEILRILRLRLTFLFWVLLWFLLFREWALVFWVLIVLVFSCCGILRSVKLFVGDLELFEFDLSCLFYLLCGIVIVLLVACCFELFGFGRLIWFCLFILYWCCFWVELV